MNDQHIFFSYSRSDSAFVLRLAKDLRAKGEDIWLDQLDIDPGVRWDKEIETALKSARKLLLVLSPTSVASENVMDEVSYALEENIKVIPVLLQPCEIPFRLRRLQFIDFSTDYSDGFQKLLAYLSGNPVSIKTENTLSQVTTTSTNSKLPISKWALGIVSVIVVAFLAFQFLPSKGEPTIKKIEVPSLIDLSLNEARTQIQKAGFVIGRTENIERSNIAANTVLEQKPRAGTLTAIGQSVDLKIAIPPKATPVAVTNVIGKQLRTAAEELKKAGLSMVTRAQNSNCSKKPGTIIAQFPSAGKMVNKGDEIQVDVVAPRQKIAAKRVPGREKLRILTVGKKTSENAQAFKETNVEFSLEGDECTTGEVRIIHPLGGTDMYNLKAGQRQSGTRYFGLGRIDLYFKSNNPKARLHVRIW